MYIEPPKIGGNMSQNTSDVAKIAKQLSLSYKEAVMLVEQDVLVRVGNKWGCDLDFLGDLGAKIDTRCYEHYERFPGQQAPVEIDQQNAQILIKFLKNFDSDKARHWIDLIERRIDEVPYVPPTIIPMFVGGPARNFKPTGPA